MYYIAWAMNAPSCTIEYYMCNSRIQKGELFKLWDEHRFAVWRNQACGVQITLSQLKDRLKLLFKDEISLVNLLSGSNQSAQKFIVTSGKLCMAIKI